MSPRVFISYSWTSPGHQARVREWAEQLVSDGVDVVLDEWDLNEGDDKFAFMERLVTDNTVTHVLVFSDSEYARKADARQAGVGTESQIISREVYAKVRQSKFIPIVCEIDDAGEPFLPTFLKSRIWINFSSPEAAHESWEQLIRSLYGKPAHAKPALGKPPVYITEVIATPASPISSKFVALKQALLQDKRGLSRYRQEFLDACFAYADSLRIRERPPVDGWGERVLEDCGKLKLVRDPLVDWVFLEAELNPSESFSESLLGMLESLLELSSRPSELNQWSEAWFEAHNIFAYETFLYIVAALIKRGAFDHLHSILTSHYLRPGGYSGEDRFTSFSAFHGTSESLQILAQPGQRLHAPAAEFVKRQADRSDISFTEINEAELVVQLMAFVSDDAWWFPQTLLYSSRGTAFPFFLRATQRRNFKKLATITGVSDAAVLRAKVKDGQSRLNTDRWTQFWHLDRGFWGSMNMDGLATID